MQTTPIIQFHLRESYFQKTIQVDCATKIKTVVKVTPFKLYELNFSLYSILLAKMNKTSPIAIMRYQLLTLKQQDPITVAKKPKNPEKSGYTYLIIFIPLLQTSVFIIQVYIGFEFIQQMILYNINYKTSNFVQIIKQILQIRKHLIMSKQIDQHILQFYQTKKLLGSGAYGHVWKVLEKQTKKVFALKKIFDAFQNSTDAQRTYRQISLLHQMDHKNVIKLHKVIKAQNKKDLYLVFEYMETDLHSLVGESILSSHHLRFVVFQILKALKYLHSAQLIHRDLKPSNVLINSDCQIKLCDFGLARSLAHQEQEQNILSQDVATRWYRSPQMLLGSRQYGKPTDIWSVGCIIAELLFGQPIFQGSSTLNQLQKIIQFTGIPSQHSIDSLKSEVAQNIINTLTVRKKSIKDYFMDCDVQLVEITTKMLDFNPNKRPTAEELLSHKIFKQFEKVQDQQSQICSKFIVPSVDDNVKLKLQEYRKIIYKDIQRRYPQFSDARIKGVCSLIQKNSLHIQKPRNISTNIKNTSLNHSINKNKNKSLKKNKSQSKKQILHKGFRTNSQTNLAYLKQKFHKQQQKNQLIKTILEPVKPLIQKESLKIKNRKENIDFEGKAEVYEKQLKKTKSKKNLLVKTKTKKVLFVNKNKINNI